jgi:glutamyl-tRNA synthetase
VLAYRELGYYPHALVNFLARLGWSHGDQEVFSRTELVHAFSLENVGKSAGVFNLEKLDWLNAHYLRARSPKELAGDLSEFMARRGLTLPGDPAWQERMVATLRERVSTLAELLDAARYYLEDDIALDEAAARKFLTADVAPLLESLHRRLAELPEWSPDGVESAFQATLEESGQKMGALAQPVRVALTGGTRSPGIYDVLEVVGRGRSLARLRAAIERASAA